MGLGDLSTDPRFETESLQIQHQNELNQILADRFKEKKTDSWMRELEESGVLCAKINDFDAVAKDPQIEANRMVIQMEGSEGDSLRLLGNPVRMHGTPAKWKQFPPNLGEHSETIVRELGYSDDDIQILKNSGVIQ
jgi:crotonobetainyl-CoA:carnitine CoA-transferase CaiB-like acyl-CoA transferase